MSNRENETFVVYTLSNDKKPNVLELMKENEVGNGGLLRLVTCFIGGEIDDNNLYQKTDETSYKEID